MSNPYTDLRNDCLEWVRTVLYAHRKAMFYFPKDKIGEANWNLTDLKERTIAAEQLGYEVIVEWREETGLHAVYRKKPGLPPYKVRP